MDESSRSMDERRVRFFDRANPNYRIPPGCLGETEHFAEALLQEHAFTAHDDKRPDFTYLLLRSLLLANSLPSLRRFKPFMSLQLAVPFCYYNSKF